MNSVNLQIQRTINETITEAINEQFSSQLQASPSAVNAQQSHNGWNFLGERPERKSEDTFSRKIRSSSKDEFLRNRNREEQEEKTHNKRFQLYLEIRDSLDFHRKLIYAYSRL